MTIDEIHERIHALEGQWVHVETNQGTYGAHEACRKCGCGDPHFANREVYMKADGETYETGPGDGRYPGYMRKIGYESLREVREELKGLRTRLRELRKSTN